MPHAVYRFVVDAAISTGRQLNTNEDAGNVEAIFVTVDLSIPLYTYVLVVK